MIQLRAGVGIDMKPLWEEFLAADRKSQFSILTIVVWPSILLAGLLLREIFLQTQHSLWAAIALLCALAFVPLTLWVALISMPQPMRPSSTQHSLPKSVALAELSNSASDRDRTAGRLRSPNRKRGDF